MGKEPNRRTSESAPEAESGAKTAKPRATLASLRKHIDSIETRLTLADMLTQKSVKAVETAFQTLEGRLYQTSEDHKSAVDTQVAQLTGKLTGLIAQTRQEVQNDFKSALTAPNIKNIDAAIERAEGRLDNLELKQAESLTKINRHIADMAVAVDAEFKAQRARTDREIKTLKTEARQMETGISRRFDQIEDDSAMALRTVASKVESLTLDMRNRAESDVQHLQKNVNEAIETIKFKFEKTKNELEQRLEKLEGAVTANDHVSKRAQDGIITRLEGLEFEVSDIQSGVENLSAKMDAASSSLAGTPITAAASPSAHPLSPPAVNYQTNETAAPEPTKLSPHNTVALAQKALQDAFTPSRAPAPVETAPPAASPQNPFSTPQIQTAPPSFNSTPPQSPSSQTTSYQPQEFNPEQSQAQPYYSTDASSMPGSAQAYQTSTVSTPIPASTPDIETPSAAYEAQTFETPDVSAPPFDTSGPDYFGDGGVITAELLAHGASETAPMPYDNPAYAEMPDAAMSSMRPGAFSTPKKPKLSLRGLPRPNKSIALLSVGIIAMSVFAVKGVLGEGGILSNNTPAPTSSAAVNPPPFSGPELGDAELGNAELGEAPNAPQIQMQEPIGQYADARPQMDPANASIISANSEAGDPVAQFRLGLSYLQAGRTDEAVKLIRAAANQEQPAAQYRLAKLYEVGEGVEKSAETAQQLTERAARNGNRLAMHDLALYYAEGRGGVKTNVETSAQWFEKAAERGVVDSQFNLGVLSESGQGLPKNLSNAYVWYAIAAKQGDQFAQQRLGIIGPQLSASEKSAADSRVSKFKPTAIDNAANGIFTTDKVALKGLSPADQVVHVQNMLSDLGYDVGGADGSIGPQTRTAIISFERANGLPETGRVNAELVDRLEQESGA